MKSGFVNVRRQERIFSNFDMFNDDIINDSFYSVILSICSNLGFVTLDNKDYPNVIVCNFAKE